MLKLSRQRDESDSGSHLGESGLRRPVPTAAVITEIQNPKSSGEFFAIINVTPDGDQIVVTREQSMNSNWMLTTAVAMLAAWPAVAQDARAKSSGSGFKRVAM